MEEQYLLQDQTKNKNKINLKSEINVTRLTQKNNSIRSIFFIAFYFILMGKICF